MIVASHVGGTGSIVLDFQCRPIVTTDDVHSRVGFIAERVRREKA